MKTEKCGALRAEVNYLETAGTAGTAERIFDTLFRCRLSRLCGLCGLCGLKKNLHQARDQISCQKGSGLASIKKLPQMGHTWRISHLGQ